MNCGYRNSVLGMLLGTLTVMVAVALFLLVGTLAFVLMIPVGLISLLYGLKNRKLGQQRERDADPLEGEAAFEERYICGDGFCEVI